MKILNFGSLNIDYVYSVDHIVAPGETIASANLQAFCGGKGLNQSIALSKAGADVYHAGMVGADGQMLADELEKYGVDIRLIRKIEQRSGNAIIQVGANGQNSIILFGGANQCNTKEYVDSVLAQFEPNDWLLLQNEVNMPEYLIDAAHAKGLKIAINPSPYNASLEACDLAKASLFFINEIEGMQITGKEDPEQIIEVMKARFPNSMVVLTLGKRGAWCFDGMRIYKHGAYDVKVVDTTAAGDTFTGYFLAALVKNKPAGECLRLASIASSISVSRMGAALSIPSLEEVLNKTCQ